MLEARSWKLEAGGRRLETSDQRSAISNQHSASTKQKLMAVIEYDGTDYHGFQIQPHQSTIQEEIEHALGLVTQEKIRIVGAGRTDSGVHAKGQVIGFTTGWTRSLEELQRALNALLPKDIAVRQIKPVPEDFHPRYSAKSRQYLYTVLNQPIRSPLARYHAYHFLQPLDVDLMAKACRHYLVGPLDLASFASGPVGKTVRTIHRAECWRENNFVYIDFVINAAFSHLIRRLVGTLLWVGTRKISVEDFAEILFAKDRKLAAPAAPAHGLCLIQVNYN